MPAKGEIGKQAIEICKDVYKGMSGKYNKFAALEGEKIVKANMTKSQIEAIEKVSKNAFEKGILKNGKRVYGQEAYEEGKKVMKKKINTVNSLPYSIGNNIGGGFRDTHKAFKESADSNLNLSSKLKSSLDKGFRKNVLNDEGKMTRELDMGKVLGASFGVGVGARIVTGGGLYKDSSGNTNLPGIPFI